MKEILELKRMRIFEKIYTTGITMLAILTIGNLILFLITKNTDFLLTAIISIGMCILCDNNQNYWRQKYYMFKYFKRN